MALIWRNNKNVLKYLKLFLPCTLPATRQKRDPWFGMMEMTFFEGTALALAFFGSLIITL